MSLEFEQYDINDNYDVHIANEKVEFFPEGVVIDIFKQAPSPSKDYCQLFVTLDKIIFRRWKITLRNEGKGASPTENITNYEDFEFDEKMQRDIRYIFGENTISHVLSMSKGEYDYLLRLPRNLLHNVIDFLDLEDVVRMSQTCKFFRKMFKEDDELWRKIYIKNSETPVTDELCKLAESIGWMKLYFTSKLQIQIKLRRNQRS